jgi:hypothetical protein
MEDTTVRVSLELRVSGDHLDGRLVTDSAPSSEFSGWVGLIAALDGLVTERSAPGPPPTAPLVRGEPEPCAPVSTIHPAPSARREAETPY